MVGASLCMRREGPCCAGSPTPTHTLPTPNALPHVSPAASNPAKSEQDLATSIQHILSEADKHKVHR